MTAIYLLATIVGLPLVGYSVFSGEGDGEGGDFEDGGIIAYLSLGTLAFFTGFFGLTGLATTAVGSGAALSFVLALGVGLVAAVTQRGLLTYVRKTSNSSHLSDVDFTGKAATVVLPIEAGRRGRIVLEAGEQRQYLTAELLTGEPAALGVGSSVVVVQVDGGVAQVAHLDPELT